jgi:hypothetical protein
MQHSHKHFEERKQLNKEESSVPITCNIYINFESLLTMINEKQTPFTIMCNIYINILRTWEYTHLEKFTARSRLLSTPCATFYINILRIWECELLLPCVTFTQTFWKTWEWEAVFFHHVTFTLITWECDFCYHV